MRLTQYTEYSFRVLIYLAEHHERRVTIRDISDSYDISYFHLTKVVHNLTSKGYIEGMRGRNGGVALAVKADQIRLDSVVRDTETLNFPSQDDSEESGSYSVLGRHLQSAVGLFLEYLSRLTLADLVADQSKQSDEKGSSTWDMWAAGDSGLKSH